MDEDILRLHIAMNDSMGEQLNKAIEKLKQVFSGNLLTKVLFLVEFGSEIASITVFLDDVVVVFSLDDVNELDDVLRVELLHDFDLGDVGLLVGLVLFDWITSLITYFLR